MQAVTEDSDWWTKSVVTGQPVKRYKARDLMRQIAEATHQCGDPGNAVRYHREPLASVQADRSHQRFQSVLRIYVPGRFGVQSVVVEPDEVR